MTISSVNESAVQRCYQALDGFFMQDTSTQGHSIRSFFGLIDDSAERWLNLEKHLQDLNANAQPGESYKLFYFYRHGQSYHNVGKDKYASNEWKGHWGRQNGDDEITWGPDSDLTPAGIAQALRIKEEWDKERDFGIPCPEKIYTSPLTRALKTCDIAFDWIANKQKSVLVVENCREGNGIEEEFSEEDEVWVPDVRETKEAIAARARSVLDKVFDEEPQITYVCFTIHGGIINAFLSILGLPKQSLSTGGVFPVIIRGYLD
ncbi:hypothetical protein Agabi119p4_10420 [Agaricus bisporus var. burnettii]|uniref:Phosphoglycerate mutase n=1 Tax=Agaricus bisporus var. burnettii TaxID=192524 RepID=A0A8H7C279_AGABI|nr:hypothetical protein Agabi119p4_10420 [Agaricus bisporus var. burnettii]